MPKKKFEEMGFNPLGNILKRDAERKRQLDEPKLEERAADEAPAIKPADTARATSLAEEKTVEVRSVREARAVQPRRRAEPEREAHPSTSRQQDSQKDKQGRLARERLPAKRVEYEAEESEAVEDFLYRLSKKAGSKFSFNILGRCLVRIAMSSESELFRELERAAPRKRPANGDSLGLGLYEDEWEKVLQRALQRSPGRS